MSMTTIAGLLVGLILFFSAILMSTKNYIMFLSIQSFILVVGGTLANAFISYQGRYVIQALGDIKRMWGHARMNETILYEESRQVIEWADIVQAKGPIALERHIKTNEASDPFLRHGIQLVVDGYKGDEVRELLTNMMRSEYQRNTRKVTVLKNMASAAPAFGMIGTLVGLIIMLESLSSDPNGIGRGLAVALLTTLYGVLIAKFLFQPAADKTLQREDIARFRNFLMMEGFVMLAEQRPPRYIRERINSFLDPAVLAEMNQLGTRPTPTEN